MMSYLLLGLLLAGTACVSSSRIVGGEDTSIEEYPYLVQVDSYYVESGTWSHACAANILTRFWILSAAHCFEGWDYSPMYRRIRAGTTFRNFGGVIHYVDFERNHPDYRIVQRYDADINVVKLITPLVYTPLIQRGTIVEQDFVLPDNFPVVYAGWGHLFWQGYPSFFLQRVQTYTINNALCTKRYQQLAKPGMVITPNMICAGHLDIGGRDSCQGDSGGPMFAGNIIVGIVSWGQRCANETFPGVATSVASYTDWIKANAK